MPHFIPSVVELVLVTQSSRHHMPPLTGVQDFILGPSLSPRVNLVLVILLSLLTLYRHAIVPLRFHVSLWVFAFIGLAGRISTENSR